MPGFWYIVVIERDGKRYEYRVPDRAAAVWAIDKYIKTRLSRGILACIIKYDELSCYNFYENCRIFGEELPHLQ
jgi:hypothetical protein